MKLKNKRTGELGTLTLSNDGETFILMNERMYTHSVKLKDLEEWEDAPEEPKEYWYIDPMVCGAYHTKIEKDEDLYDFNKQIGNYFETKEEAKKAVERLRAWKRLKDFGCGFMLDDHFTVKFVGPDARKITSAEIQRSLSDDYKLLFGGEG